MNSQEVLVADVAIDRAGQTQYSYAVPEELKDLLSVGDMVQVPLRNRQVLGFVIAIEQRAKPTYRLRNVSWPKQRVRLTAALMYLAEWASRYYRCSLPSFLNAVVPSPVRKCISMQKTRLLNKIPIADEARAGLTKRQRDVYDTLPDYWLTFREACLEAACSAGTLERLIENGACQQRYESGIQEQRLEVDAEDHDLSQEQQAAVDAVTAQLEKERYATFLLYGVTGSGKTLVYMDLAAQVIKHGKQVLILLPEIALTPQLAARFRQRFARVSIWHSGFTDGERAAAWHAAAAGEIDLIIGTRSALFAPLPNVGLVVVDEEHDQSYKQDSAPRYQGRDLAIVYAQHLQVPIILGSATPSCETIQNARSGKYHILQLKERPSGSALPASEIVDMREECKKQRKQAIISDKLLDALRETHQLGQQSIVLLNRRGWTPVVSCPRCGYVFKCEDCDISMTWHRGSGRLRCHLCSKEQSLPSECPVCDFPELAHKGIGTERLADVIQSAIPELNILRMDADTINKRQGHADIIQAFGRGDADCLLGTQMVAKGLNFPRVTLVGVVAADQGLAAPDFRAAERTYQLIAQVSGRAGRAEQAGRVIVQCYDTAAMAIVCALENRPKTFFDSELAIREQHHYPPFNALMRVLWRSEDPHLAARIAQQQTQAMRKFIDGETLLGPSPAGISFMKGQHRWHCLVKAASKQAIQHFIKRITDAHILAPVKDVITLIDVDPYEFS